MLRFQERLTEVLATKVNLFYNGRKIPEYNT